MASIRTEKEIRQRAPLWLGMLLFANLVVMAVDARNNFVQQRIFRGWMQAVVSPFQRATSSASGAGAGVIRQIVNFRSTAIENEQLKQRLAETELALRNAHEASSENERLKGLLNLKELTGYGQVAAILSSVCARPDSA